MRRLAALCLGALIAGCTTTSSPVLLAASPSPSPQHAYVVGSHQIFGYALPLSSASTASIGIGLLVSLSSDCADAQGRLFVTNSVFTLPQIYVFTQPISSSSTVAFALSDFNTGALGDCAVDGGGNLYVVLLFPGAEVQLDVLPGPVQPGSSAIDVADIPVNRTARGITTDSSGNVFLYVTPKAAPSVGIMEFSSRAAGNHLIASFGEHNPSDQTGGIKIGPDGNLYVADGTSIGAIDVYPRSAFRNGGAKDHSIAVASTPLADLDFDRNGNMIVIGVGSASSTLYVLPPPYSAPSLALPMPGVRYGIAITQ